MSKKVVVGIDKEQIEENKRYDLIFRSINLALLELGVNDLKFNCLPDSDNEIKIEIEKN